jgi:hypothetical protein
MTAPQPTFYESKTIPGIQRELALLLNITPTYDLTTTINSKYGIFQSVSPTTIAPSIQYFGIGINGFTNVDDGNLANPNLTSITDLDQFSPIPFRCVPVEQDLDPTTMANYRMRQRRTINGNDYFLYWLKVITFNSTTVQLTQTDPTTGVQTPYVINNANLNPTVPIIPINGITPGDSIEVNVTVPATLNYTGLEVAEYITVVYNDLRYAKISELGIYSGVDKSSVGATGSGGSLTYTESIFTQLTNHRTWLGDDMSSPTSVQNRQILFGNGSVLLIS